MSIELSMTYSRSKEGVNQCSCKRGFPAVEVKIPLPGKMQVILLAHVNGL